MNSILSLNLLLDSFSDSEEIGLILFALLSIVLALFFVYLLLYYIFRGVEILIEPMFKSRKIKLDISPALSAFLTILLVFVIFLILVLTNVISLKGIIEVLNRIFG